MGQDRGRHLSSHATVFILLATFLSMFCQTFLSTYHDWEPRNENNLVPTLSEHIALGRGQTQPQFLYP